MKRPGMRTATTVEGSSGNWAEITAFACEAEKLGLDICWVAEAWGSDAPSPLGYLAARTETMLLGSAVIQVGTRSPVVIAQTAMTLAHLSGGRFLLGLGVSGPQVLEGLHGVPFAHPLARMRETVQIVRSVFTGEKVRFTGSEYRIPLPGGDARPMRVSLPPTSVPVYLAALSPKMLELTGEIADGWLGTSFVPEGADAYFTHLDAGLARAGRTRADLDICQGAEVSVVDEAHLPDVLASRKKELAFSLGGMGSGTSNFYNDAYSRQGWADVAARVRARWQAGDHDGAAALVTDEMVLATTLIGTEDMVRARLQTWRDTGVDTVRLYPAGETLTARLDNLGRAIDLVRALAPPKSTEALESAGTPAHGRGWKRDRQVDLGLKDKVALVGAASKGLGKASALALAREGARVTICARTEADLDAAAQEIRAETGAEVLAVPADLTSAADIKSVVAATAERFGGVDVLVNNSGGPAHGRFADLTDDDWRQAFEVVTLNFVRFVREVVPYMRHRPWGRIIGIQSSSVKEPVDGIDLSNGIRPGIAGLMKAIMPGLARDGITINLVLPGAFLTPRVSPDAGRSTEGDQELQARLAPLATTIPLGRFGEPIELGNLVAFLASQQASYITGAVYQVDGGALRSNV